MLKSFFLSQKKLLNAILRAKFNYMKIILSNEMNSFLQCRRQIFNVFELFAEKVILELNMHKITSLELLRNTNSVFSATKQIMRMLRPQMLKKLLSQSEKLAKCNFKSKAQLHEKCSF